MVSASWRSALDRVPAALILSGDGGCKVRCRVQPLLYRGLHLCTNSPLLGALHLNLHLSAPLHLSGFSLIYQGMQPVFVF